MVAIRVGFGRQIRAVNVDRRSAQRRGSCAKCQQMGPEVAVRYSIAWGVKLKEGLSPEEKGAFSLNLLFSLVRTGRLQSTERRREKNWQLIALHKGKKMFFFFFIGKAIEPGFYRRLNSVQDQIFFFSFWKTCQHHSSLNWFLSIHLSWKYLYVFQKMSQIFKNAACPMVHHWIMVVYSNVWLRHPTQLKANSAWILLKWHIDLSSIVK